MSGHPAVQAALRNHHFDSLGLTRLPASAYSNSVEPPWYATVRPVVWEGRCREVPPIPILGAIRPFRASRPNYGKPPIC